MSSLYFQKWDPCVQREVEKSCALCGKDFSFVRREHQCKRCLRAVCSDCSGDKVAIYKQGFVRKPHRGCKVCAEQQRQVAELIEANRLQFGCMSPVGSKWLARIEKRPVTASIDNRKHKKFTREVFARMWDAYNYSLREFMGLLTFDREQDDIYRSVSDVVTSVVSIVPEEDLESVAFLAAFVLCFCSPDKAPFLCLYLLDLKAAVANEQGLLQAYLRAAGMGEGALEKLKDYQRHRVRRFLGSFSVNSVSAKTSMEVIQRVISKRRIDEVFIQLALSLQMLRDSILARKDNLPYCDLLMIRLCTPEATSSKYKLPAIASVKSANFMKEKNEFAQESSSFLASENSFARSQRENNSMAASFSEGIRGSRVGPSANNPEPFPAQEVHPAVFRKRADLKEDSFIEDSFSMISMIDEINQASQKNGRAENEGNELLSLMSQAQQKSNDSLEIKREIYGSGEKPHGFPQLNLSLGEVIDSTKGRRPIECEKCLSANRTIASLMRELDEIKLQKARQEEEYKKEIKSLQEKVKTGGSAKTSENSAMQKLEYESQIRKLRQSLLEFELKDRQYQGSLLKVQESKKQQMRLQQQLKIANQQLSESATTIKLLKNKVETQSFSLPQGRPTGEATDTLKINEILKQSMRQKNQEIQELSKKNKLIQYQLEELAKERLQDKEKAELRQKTARLEKEKEELIGKMKELSNLLMEMESEKLNLSEEVFELKDALRAKGVIFSQS